MKITKNFEEVKSVIRNFMESHEDYNISPYNFTQSLNRQIDFSDLSEEDAGAIKTLKSMDKLELYSDYGVRSLTKRLGAMKMEHLQQWKDDGYDDLVSLVINARLESFFHKKGRQAKNLLVRDFGGKHCAVLTNRYAIFDDDEVCEILSGNKYLMDVPEIWYDCTPERFHVRFISGEKLFVRGDTSPLSMAIFVDNSMIGKSAFRIRFGLYRWACTNGMIFGLRDYEIVREFHKGIKDYRQIVGDALKDIHIYEESLLEIVDNAIRTESSVAGLEFEKAQAFLVKKLNVSGKKAETILQLYQKYGGHTKWDLINAITDAAHESSLLERLNLESNALKAA